MKEKETLKQIKIFSIILVIVIITAIYIGIKEKNEVKNNNIENSSTIDMNNVVIDGYTKNNINTARGFLDEESYNKLVETFDKIENGEENYEKEMSIKNENSGVTPEETKKSEKELQNAINSGNWHYYVMEDGTVTNTIVFDDGATDSDN